MTRRDEVRRALEQAIKRAEQRSAEGDYAQVLDPTSKADAAIQKLRENRRLSREELDRPVTI